MNPREEGFLLLTSQLGDPERKPLSVAQLRTLAARVRASDRQVADRELSAEDITALGYSREMAQRILSLLEDKELLDYYLYKGRRSGCVPLTRAGDRYPQRVRRYLGDDSPGCLWAKGDISLLDTPCIGLVGSRELWEENRCFAREAGLQAARQGYTLVSGNARGADKTAQEACLQEGGNVISVVADSLEKHGWKERVLYLSEECFDGAFSSQRALSRNRVIHCLGRTVLVAQCSLGSGGTWDGTLRNLKGCWSRVCYFRDGSPASLELEQMGALPVDIEQLRDLHALEENVQDLFDRV